MSRPIDRWKARIRHPGEPWKRLRNESAAAYELFMGFVHLGPDRTLGQAVEQSGRSYNNIRQTSSRNGWYARAMAWDDNAAKLQAARDATEVEAGAEAHERQVQRMDTDQASLGRAFQSLALLRIRELEKDVRDEAGQPDAVRIKGNLTLDQAMALAERGARMERLARGEATDRVDQASIDRLVAKLIKCAMRYVPDEAKPAFLDDLQDVAGLAS